MHGYAVRGTSRSKDPTIDLFQTGLFRLTSNTRCTIRGSNEVPFEKCKPPVKGDFSKPTLPSERHTTRWGGVKGGGGGGGKRQDALTQVCTSSHTLRTAPPSSPSLSLADSTHTSVRVRPWLARTSARLQGTTLPMYSPYLHASVQASMVVSPSTHSLSVSRWTRKGEKDEANGE